MTMMIQITAEFFTRKMEGRIKTYQIFVIHFLFFHEWVNVNGATDFLLRFLCGEDESLFEDLAGGPSSSSQESSFFMSMNDPVLSRLSQKSGIQLGTVASMFRIEITVSRGKANFQLHGILGRKDQIRVQVFKD